MHQQSAGPNLQACLLQGAAIQMTNDASTKDSKNLFWHIQLLHTQEGLDGVQVGCDLSLKQLDKDNLKTKSRTRTQLGAQNISLFLILDILEVSSIPRLFGPT